jgi:hypothetical protein
VCVCVSVCVYVKQPQDIFSKQSCVSECVCVCV